MSGSIFVTVVNGTVVREPMFYENEKSNALHWTLLVEDTTTVRSKKTYIDIVAFGWLADNKRSEISAGDTITVNGKLESFKAKNSDTFKVHVENKPIGPSKIISRFYEEAYELCKFSDEHLQILDALMKLHIKDERAHEGLIAKLMQDTNLSRSSIVCFFRIIRLRCHDFSDSPVNEVNNTAKNILGSGEPEEFEDR